MTPESTLPPALEGQIGTRQQSPQQAAGTVKLITAVADIYALGALLYECLTGRPPFRGATALDTVVQVMTLEPVAPRQLQPGCPRDLETICLKCLRKEPRNRYRTAREVADDLGRFLAGEPIHARPVGPLERSVKWVKRRPFAAALLAVTAAAVASLAVAFALVVREQHHARQSNRTASAPRSPPSSTPTPRPRALCSTPSTPTTSRFCRSCVRSAKHPRQANSTAPGPRWDCCRPTRGRSPICGTGCSPRNSTRKSCSWFATV